MFEHPSTTQIDLAMGLGPVLLVSVANAVDVMIYLAALRFLVRIAFADSSSFRKRSAAIPPFALIFLLNFLAGKFFGFIPPPLYPSSYP